MIGMRKRKKYPETHREDNYIYREKTGMELGDCIRDRCLLFIWAMRIKVIYCTLCSHLGFSLVLI